MLDAAVEVASGSNVATDGTGFYITVKWQQHQQQQQQQTFASLAGICNVRSRHKKQQAQTSLSQRHLLSSG
jgi:hypothetical protein